VIAAGVLFIFRFDFRTENKIKKPTESIAILICSKADRNISTSKKKNTSTAQKFSNPTHLAVFGNLLLVIRRQIQGELTQSQQNVLLPWNQGRGRKLDILLSGLVCSF
jgi:hypothetical protein